MDSQDLENLRKDLVKLRSNMTNMNFEAKRDLLKMFKNINRMLLELDTENIVCRRKGKTTEKYSKLLKEIESQKETLELYHVMGRLM